MGFDMISQNACLFISLLLNYDCGVTREMKG